VEERPEKMLEGVESKEAAKTIEHVERVEEERAEEAMVEKVEEAGEEIRPETGVAEGAGGGAPEKPVEEAGGKPVYDGVEIDHVERLRPPIRAEPGELYLIDVPGLTAPWIPTPLIVELFRGARPITLERRMHYGKDVEEELYNTVRKICLLGETVPVIVVGRPGYIWVDIADMRMKVKDQRYVDRLGRILKRLRDDRARRYAVAIPLQVYKRYCTDMPDLLAMRKIVYIVDVNDAVRELSGRIPDTALHRLKVAASLSPTLLSQLSRSPGQVSWRPIIYEPREATGEEEALAWAVRTIISKGGPLTVDEVIKAGYKDYLDSLIVLGMVERG
jgi:hypothetical protein